MSKSNEEYKFVDSEYNAIKRLSKYNKKKKNVDIRKKRRMKRRNSDF